MAEARAEQQWNHTASLLAMLVNVNRDPRSGRAARPIDFHPLARRVEEPVLKVDIGVLKQVFVKS